MIEHFNYSLLPHNTFHIEARCRRYVEYDSEDELRKILPSLMHERFLHIGGGSNLLFLQDFPGTILHSAIRSVDIVKSEGDDVWVRAGAGIEWDQFVEYCIQHGLYGLENLSLIPGEVGASAVQNIGAYGVEAADLLTLVETIDVATGEIESMRAEECQYGYRTSIFKNSLRGKRFVTHVTYKLSRRFVPRLDYAALRRELEARGLSEDVLTAADLRRVIIDVRREKLPEPSETGSAGSFFVNPVVNREHFERLLAAYPEMPHYLLPDGSVKIPAGWLIQQAGWRGRQLGRAGVWPKQALVLTNLGGATGKDILALSDAICTDVEKSFGIALQPEVNFI